MYLSQHQFLIVTCIYIIIISRIATSKEIPVECDVLEQHLHIKSCTLTLTTCIVSEVEVTPGDFFSFTNGHETNFTSFELHSSLISSFPKEIFTELPMLEHVDLNGNELQVIPDKTFEYAANLTDLELQFNQLREITGETFTGLRKLLKLDLSTNQIKTVSPKAFRTLKQLEYLDLSSNVIKVVEEETFAPLINLKSLYLNHNDIMKVHPKSFVAHQHLITLDFDGNRIERLELWLSDVTLNALHLARNQLSSVSIKKSTENIMIRSLNLQNNYFTTLSNIKIDPGVVVRNLNLDSNEITSVSDFPPFFTNITRLYLHTNPITEIDFSPLHDNQLRHLDIGDLSDVALHSRMFESLNELRSLTLSDNFLRGIDHEWFIGLSNLTELDLENNFIMNFDYKELVKALPTLKVLKISHNDLNCTFLREMIDNLKNSSNITFAKGYVDSYFLASDDGQSYEGIECDTRVEQPVMKIRDRNVGLRVVYWTIVTVVGLVGVIVGLLFAGKKLNTPIVWPKWRRPVRRNLEIVVNGNTGVVQERQ